MKKVALYGNRLESFDQNFENYFQMYGSKNQIISIFMDPVQF